MPKLIDQSILQLIRLCVVIRVWATRKWTSLYIILKIIMNNKSLMMWNTNWIPDHILTPSSSISKAAGPWLNLWRKSNALMNSSPTCRHVRDMPPGCAPTSAIQWMLYRQDPLFCPTPHTCISSPWPALPSNHSRLRRHRCKPHQLENQVSNWPLKWTALKSRRNSTSGHLLCHSPPHPSISMAAGPCPSLWWNVELATSQ